MSDTHIILWPVMGWIEFIASFSSRSDSLFSNLQVFVHFLYHIINVFIDPLLSLAKLFFLLKDPFFKHVSFLHTCWTQVLSLFKFFKLFFAFFSLLSHFSQVWLILIKLILETALWSVWSTILSQWQSFALLFQYRWIMLEKFLERAPFKLPWEVFFSFTSKNLGTIVHIKVVTLRLNIWINWL